MTYRTAPAATSTPLWSSFESAVRRALGSLSASSSTTSPFLEIEGEQARIRRTSRHWLIG